MKISSVKFNNYKYHAKKTNEQQKSISFDASLVEMSGYFMNADVFKTRGAQRFVTSNNRKFYNSLPYKINPTDILDLFLTQNVKNAFKVLRN